MLPTLYTFMKIKYYFIRQKSDISIVLNVSEITRKKPPKFRQLFDNYIFRYETLNLLSSGMKFAIYVFYLCFRYLCIDLCS